MTKRQEIAFRIRCKIFNWLFKDIMSIDADARVKSVTDGRPVTWNKEDK